MDDEVDFSKLKYVLYARKSTDDPQRQVRSIPDQIFLNFTVDEEKVLSYQLKPHFEEMLKSRQQRTSRDGALTLEHLQPLVDSILDNWNPATFEEQLHIIQSINNNPQMQYNQPYEY